MKNKSSNPFIKWFDGHDRSDGVPAELTDEADLVAIKGARICGEHAARFFREDVAQSIRQERPGDFPPGPNGAPVYKILGLSGGGSRGSFGAGYIYGWTLTGRRPQFKLVTGVSTGAMVAPFAFLGPEYNEELLDIFTHLGARKVFRVRNFVSWLWHDSFADTQPLANLLMRYADEKALKAVAAAHARGRRLYIGTTNLDAQCQVIWNMGAIAASNHPDAPLLFRNVLLASASIPGMFPPVYFDVEARGQRYREMHVDGEVMGGVFFNGFMVDLPALRSEIIGDTEKAAVAAYVICNGKLSSNPVRVGRSLPSIIRRTIKTLNKAHERDHIYHIFSVLLQKQSDLNYLAIPDDYPLPDDKPGFDAAEMTHLFNLGAEMAASGYPWCKFPPGLENCSQHPALSY
ncbi:MAG: patatin-like phospholipase family protein [Phycisphaerae bacterium]|nr:patatin-like phospholipase family protein [Phycisphaerae bacterium]